MYTKIIENNIDQSLTYMRVNKILTIYIQVKIMTFKSVLKKLALIHTFLYLKDVILYYF